MHWYLNLVIKRLHASLDAEARCLFLIPKKVILSKYLEWNHHELTPFRWRKVCTIWYTNFGGVTMSFWPPRISMGFLTSEWQ
jgi:hypothetical protein